MEEVPAGVKVESRATARRRGLHRAGRDHLLQIAVHIGALIPLALLIWDGLHHNLTVNPIQAITSRTGKAALVLLVLSLACTPASSLFGLRLALRWRRPLGLYAFMYVALHFLTFAVLDYGLDPALLREAIFQKRYALVGFVAFLLLLPLAVTSTRGWMRRLGKNWKRLHRLVYVAALLAVMHYVWLVKSDIRVPLTYGGVVGLLLLMRTRPVKRTIGALRAFARHKTNARVAKPEASNSPQGCARSLLFEARGVKIPRRRSG